MGLLDNMPGLDTAQGQGLLAAAFSMMGAKGKGLGNAIGEAGRTYMGATTQAQNGMDERELRRLQLDSAHSAFERDKQMRAAAQGAFRSHEMANAMSQGPAMDGGAVPQVQPGFSPQKYAQSLYAIDPLEAMKFERANEKDNAPISVAAGGSLFDRASGKAIFTAPKEAATPANVQEYNFAQGQGYKGSFLDFQLAQKKAGASSVNVSMSDGQKGFENEMKIRDAFKQEPIYKAHQEVKSAFDQVNAALSSGTPVGDLAGATKIMKILDPTSVVRESELGMAMAAGGRMDRLQNYVKQSMDGTKLTPQQRKDFGNLASELTAASAQTYNLKRDEYRSQGADYGLNADRALGKPVDVPSVMKPLASLPPAVQHKGKAIRDTSTGKILRSNGMSWVEDK